MKFYTFKTVKKSNNKLVLYFIFLLCLGLKLNAQNSDSTEIKNLKIDSLNIVNVTLKDGGKVKGYLVLTNKTEIKVYNEITGIITIPFTNIINIKKINNNTEPEKFNNQVNPKNPNNTEIVKLGDYEENSKYIFIDFEPQIYTHKYYMGNNYFGLKKKEFVYQNLWVLYNGIDYGLTDNFSIGGGCLMMFVTGIVNIHLRGQFELNEYIKLGGAYNLFYVAGGSNSITKTFGIFTGGVTIGNKFSNISLSMGKGNLRNNEPNGPSNPDLNNYGYVISGMLKLNKKTYLITDNFLMNKYEEKYFSLGLRFLSKNTAFDTGLMGNTYMVQKDGYYNQTNGNYVYEKTESAFFYPFLALTHKIN
jgi:hypothetical protein